MKIFYKLFCFLFLLNFFAILSIQAKEENLPEWKDLFLQMEEEEKQYLESFFKTMFVNSEGGFVLFGSKPMCMEGIFSNVNNRISWLGARNHRRSVDLKLGFQVWDKYFSNIKSNKLVICCKNKPHSTYLNWIHLVFINPKKITEAVNKNLSLFRYILGPKLTASSFLNYIIDKDQDIPLDYTLSGILLGFGLENSLHFRRLELIESSKIQCRELAPLKSKFMRLNIEDPYQGIYLGFDKEVEKELNPSFSYKNLAEEYKFLLNGKKSSLQFNSKIPLFAIYDLDEETIHLIENYIHDQKKIENLLKESNFLEKTLELIFE